MDSKRIMIIGCCGSGKSTLARQLNEKLSIPIIHLDKLFWRAGWKNISDEEFDRLLDVELQKDSWIMDGNYNHTVAKRLEYSDAVIYLDYPRIICLLGVIKRVLTHYGRTRADMSENCPEKFDLEFLKYTWNFNKKYRNKYLRMLENYDNLDIHIFKNRRECKRFLESM